MDKYIAALKYLSGVLVALSLFFVVYSLFTRVKFDSSPTITRSVESIYDAVSLYIEFYKFTFVVCAFWVTLQQLRISQNNYNTTSRQIKFVQDDILEKRNKDIVNETLKQCNLFLGEMQTAFRELIEKDAVNGMPLEWKHLQAFTNASLAESSPGFYKNMGSLERGKKNNMLITLYKSEAFASFFMHGNLDKKLGQDIIGDTYVKQVGFLLGVISFFRKDAVDVFGQNTIRLYTEWQTDKEVH